MPIMFQHQKLEQNIGYTRLLDFDPDRGHKIGTNDFRGSYTPRRISYQNLQNLKFTSLKWVHS